MNEPTINERLAMYHRAPYAFKGRFGAMLSTALHCYWLDRYGAPDTLSRLRVSTARIGED